MATPRRSVPDHRLGDANGSAVRRKSGVPRTGYHAGNVGLSAIYHSNDSNNQRPKGSQRSAAEISLLSELLEKSVGDSAPLVAKEIARKYGSIGAILASSDHPIFSDPELAPAARDRLCEIAAVVGSAWQHALKSGPIFTHAGVLAKYLHFEMAALPREQFRVLFLDAANQLVRDEVMWEGSVNHVQIHPREVVRLALDVGASALVLAHNHPSGKPKPSREDISLTHHIIRACKLLEIIVHDHLIIAACGVFSMRKANRHLFEGLDK